MLRSYCTSFKFGRLTQRPPRSFRPTPLQALPAALQSYLHVAVVRHPCPLNNPFLQPYLLERRVDLRRRFHASHRNEGIHLLPFFVTLFKSSATINCVLGAVRISLTLIPMALLGKHGSRKWIQKLDRKFKDSPELQTWRPRLMRRLRFNTIALRVLLFVPTVLFTLVVLSSVERTPLTGRIRLIVLSADEEEGIARDLSGTGWFIAINDVLTSTNGPPKFIPPTDWRYIWVERILRRLESVVPELQDNNRANTAWLDRGRDDLPFPPPAAYPLVPRPRMAQSLHYLEPPKVSSEHQGHHVIGDVPPRAVLGPPYSLLVNDQPNDSNAFSYGFGPNGSGGVVIFSGVLDEIIRNTGGAFPSEPPTPASFLGYLSRLFSPPTSSSTHPIPTPAQDAQLAILVAHELAHLLLSHHLETLSSGKVFWPSLTSMVTDLLRALLFPITMVGGPFINDALEQVGEIGKREFTTAVDTCSSQQMEIEADIVSIRLLALAGWDARCAPDYWESRVNTPARENVGGQLSSRLPGVRPGSLWASQSDDNRSPGHPLDALRVEKLRKELERWESERQRARAQQHQSTTSV